MAINITTPSAKIGFIDNCTSSDVSGTEEIHAAVAGKKIKIKHLTVKSTDAIAITIGAGETGGAVTTALIGPMPFSALETIQYTFAPPMELPEATSLTIDADGAGAICVFVQGVIE